MFSACVPSWSLVSYHAPVRRWRASPLLIHFWQLKVQKFKGLQLDSLNNVLFTFDCLVLHTESSFFKIPEFQSNLWTPRVMISLWYLTRRKNSQKVLEIILFCKIWETTSIVTVSSNSRKIISTIQRPHVTTHNVIIIKTSLQLSLSIIIQHSSQELNISPDFL